MTPDPAQVAAQITADALQDLTPLAAAISARFARSPWTQQQAAESLNMTRQALNARLNGRTRWSADELPAVALLLGVTVAELYADNEVCA